MKTIKCPNCGAHVSKNTKGTLNCEYCNSPLVSDEPVVSNSINEASRDYHQNDTTQNSRLSHGPRPKISIFLAIIFLWLNIFVGIAYIALIKHKQREWDKEHY